MRCSASGRVHGRICGSSNLATNCLGAAEISPAQSRSHIGYSFSDARNWRRDFVRFPLQDWTRGSAHPVSDNETQQIAEPIYYDDGKVIHACDSAIMERGIRLV
jgi:hypothetical protein